MFDRYPGRGLSNLLRQFAPGADRGEEDRQEGRGHEGAADPQGGVDGGELADQAREGGADRQRSYVNAVPGGWQ
ncbi:hypothetical protein [Streptacidiphilus albus]|uniref:hypothetical protein n=1 Tax=Streptacidiphilus albus TaxID=105425 RepID=UPI00054BEF75|nr:hypothetical protein [Streptacidiphilus albus]